MARVRYNFGGVKLEKRYDAEWNEVKVINRHALLRVYVSFMIRGLGFLAVTWSTVVLLGGFVSMIDKPDFRNLTVITLVQILWIDDSFLQRVASATDLFMSSATTVINLFRGKRQLAHNTANSGHRKVNPIVALAVTAARVVGWVLALVKNVALCSCILGVSYAFMYGLYITAWISIRGLKEHGHYGQADKDKINLDPAHKVLYVVCLAQMSLLLCRIMLMLQAASIVKQVSQAYGFEDGDQAVAGYLLEIINGCLKKPSSAGERNLVTYAVELMESKSHLSDSFLSGTLILDRLLARQHSDETMKAHNSNEPEEEKQEQQQQQEQQLDLGKEPPLIIREKKKMKWEGSTKKRQQQHRQTEQEFIRQQHRVIKRIIGSESSTKILKKLLETLPSRHSYDRKAREAAARIVEHVARGICLEQFPRGIQCISSLINTFEEYRQLKSYLSSSSRLESFSGSDSDYDSESDSDNDSPQSFKDQVLSRIRFLWKRAHSKGSSNVAITTSKSETDNGTDQPSSSKAGKSKNNPFPGYKELVLTGLHILWKLAASNDNCIVISKTKNLLSKIMAPVNDDLVHHSYHSAWSIKITEVSLKVILRLVTIEGETGDELRRQISNQKKAIASLESIVRCEEECIRGGELQMKAMQILTQLCMDETAKIDRGTPTKILVRTFLNGNSSDGSIRKTAGKTLVALFLGSISIATLLTKEESKKLVDDLENILLQVEGDDICRESAAEILEHLCIQYTEKEQYLSALKDTMKSLMPKLLREILSGWTGEEGNPGYTTPTADVESQVSNNNDKNNKKLTSTSPGENKHHKLYVAMLSLCVTACEKLNLDINEISAGERVQEDKGEHVAFRFARKMVQSNRHLITPDSLKAIKLTTRMVITAIKKLRGHGTVIEQPAREILMVLLSSVSETMVDLERCMVFATGTTALPDTTDTLNFLMKEAQDLHDEIKDQHSEIVPAS